MLLVNSRLETKSTNDVLFNQSDAEHKFLTLVISGDINVTRTLDDVEIGRGKCTVGCYFGVYKALGLNNIPPDAEPETPVKEGGTGVNNCVIKAASHCEILRIPLGNISDVLPEISRPSQGKQDPAKVFSDRLLEKLAAGIHDLERLNGIMLDRRERSSDNSALMQEEWVLPPKKRTYFRGVPEVQREEIQDAFRKIQNLWRHITRGARTVPKGSVDLIKEFLGESGSQCYDDVFVPMEEPTAPQHFDEETFWFCWIHFLTRSLKHASGNLADGDDNVDLDADKDESPLDATKSKGVISITLENCTNLPPMDTFTGKADPYTTVTVDGMIHKTQVKTGTLDPIFNETVQFNAIAGQSVVHLRVYDSESMGQDREIGELSFSVSSNPVKQILTGKLTGQTADGRPAQGMVKCSFYFIKGAKAAKSLETKTEFQHFCESENYRSMILWYMNPKRRIETSFFKVPLQVHEREFTKAVGSLSVPLTGLNIKQYLTYLLVEHSYQVDVYSCREFCGFFKRKLDGETSITFRDIVKLVKERGSGVNNKDVYIGSSHVFNPQHWILRGWDTLARLVSLYHIFTVPVRIAFSPMPSLTSRYALFYADLIADIIIFLTLLLTLNVAYKNSKSQWVTKRVRIFKNIDWVLVLAVVPFEWIVFLSGMDPEIAIWFRTNKTLVVVSRITPNKLIYSTRGGSLRDLMFMFGIICHITACIYFYIGRQVPFLNLGIENSVSWLYVDPESDLETYDRHAHFAMKVTASGIERYLLSLYWVVSTITCQGVTGYLVPQNQVEVVYSIFLLAINLTIYRWIQGEISNIFMSADDKVIRTREEQDRILKFISVKAFSRDLQERIQSHFLVVSGNVSEEEEILLASLSHGLRVELARWVWRDFLTKVYLFRGCSGQFLDSVCVLLQEVHYGPEESICHSGEVTDHLVILVYGAFETFSDDSPKVRKISRRGHAASTLSFFFGVRQYMNIRAARSGAICIRLTREGIQEAMQVYPKDEESVHMNTLNFFSKEKQSEGSVAFSLHSGDTGDDDDDMSDEDDGKSTASRGTTKSGDSKCSKSSNRSGDSGEDKGKKKIRKAKAVKPEVAAISGGDGACSIDSGGAEEAAQIIEDDALPLMKEADHVPIIKEKMVEQKIVQLLTASSRGEIAAVESILTSDTITLNSKDPAGRTPLHVAASEGHDNLVEYLLDLKADAAAKDKYGNTPFNDAVRSKHNLVVKAFKRHDPGLMFKLGGNESGVLMCKAAFDGRLDDIKRLVDNGVDPNESDYDQRTAMHLAASEGQMDILEYLVGIKANIMCRDRFNGTPLEDAVRHNFEVRNAPLVQKLLRDHGATLSGEGLTYVVKMCEYAAEGTHICIICLCV